MVDPTKNPDKRGKNFAQAIASQPLTDTARFDLNHLLSDMTTIKV